MNNMVFKGEVSSDLNDIDRGLPQPPPMLECVAQDCPHLVKKGMVFINIKYKV